MYDAKLLTAAELTVVSLTLDRRIDSSRSDGWPSASALPTAVVAPRVRSEILPRLEVTRPFVESEGSRRYNYPHWYAMPADVFETADILHVKPWVYGAAATSAAERSPCKRITVVLPDMLDMPAGQVFQLKIACDYPVSLVDERYAPIFDAQNVAGFVSLLFFNDTYYVEYAR